jgi:hypothetical protein
MRLGLLLSMGCVGYFTHPLTWPRRLWTLVAAAFFVMPPVPWLSELAADAVGLVLGALFIASEWTVAPRPLAPPLSVEKRS